MSEFEATQADETQGGAPMWMVTYGDTITLLLTFFVLLLTFSTPDEEQYHQFARGLLSSSRSLGFPPRAVGQNSMVAQEQRLAASRLAQDGAEIPALYDEAPLNEMKYHHEAIDISELRDLVSAYVIRVPLVELFGMETELDPDGNRILDYVVRMTRASTYSIVVRARASTGKPGEERDSRSIMFALKAMQYIRGKAGNACPDIGVSNDDCELSTPPLSEGECEIIMLEV